jgi:insulysin
MIKPLVDDRKYRVIKLTNNLEALLISDVNTSRCSTSMSVGVGSFQDDDDVLGLAHFTEHMIFLGSKTYPRPGEFEEHLSNYFGLTNAFTEDEKTTFYFDVGCRGFQKSLIMFSRMFAEPLFDLNYMNKEIDAVNSENEKNLNQDSWKEHQLLKHLADQSHPYNRFSTGNNITLRIVDKNTLHKRLNNFYNKFYVPSNMRLVVLSNQSLDNIENNIAQYFSDIRLDMQQKDSIQFDDIRNNKKAFSKNELGKLVWYQKIAQSDNLDIIFVLDEIKSHQHLKPLDYVIYLLRYLGKGSLFNHLKSKKYATKMEVGLIASYKNFSEFAISISLTEEGIKNIESILDASFKYIELIKSSKVDPRVFDEIHNMTKINFKFLEKNEKYGDYLASLAGNMFEYNYNDILYGDYLHNRYNETIIRQYIDSLSVDNSLILIGSDNYDNNTKAIFGDSALELEPWYGTKFVQMKYIHKTFNNTYDFKLRPANEYITNEYNIVSCLDDMVIHSNIG